LELIGDTRFLLPRTPYIKLREAEYVDQTAGAPCAPQLRSVGIASAELSSVLAAQRSGSSREASGGPAAPFPPRQQGGSSSSSSSFLGSSKRPLTLIALPKRSTMARVWEAMARNELVQRPLSAKLGDTVLGQGKSEARKLYRAMISNLPRVMTL
jgi:hypothetical protein